MIFALGEGVEEHRHRANVESHRPHAKQVRRDARRFATDVANGPAAGRNLPAHQFFHGQRVSDVIGERRNVIEPIGVRYELVVLHVFGDFFVAAMQETNIGCGFGYDLAIELEHQPQDSMGRGMRWPHVEHHFLTNVPIGLTQLRLCGYHASYRVWGLHLAGRKSHKIDNCVYAREYAITRKHKCARSWSLGTDILLACSSEAR